MSSNTLIFKSLCCLNYGTVSNEACMSQYVRPMIQAAVSVHVLPVHVVGLTNMGLLLCRWPGQAAAGLTKINWACYCADGLAQAYISLGLHVCRSMHRPIPTVDLPYQEGL